MRKWETVCHRTLQSVELHFGAVLSISHPNRNRHYVSEGDNLTCGLLYVGMPCRTLKGKEVDHYCYQVLLCKIIIYVSTSRLICRITQSS